MSSAETLPGPATEMLAADCRELNAFAIFGLLERAGNQLFNSAALVGPQGFIGSYRKTHLPCLGVDRCTVVGDRPYQVFDLGGLRVGMLICYDGSFPEPSRVLALNGADLIALPTNWPEQGAAIGPRADAGASLGESAVFRRRQSRRHGGRLSLCRLEPYLRHHRRCARRAGR